MKGEATGAELTGSVALLFHKFDSVASASYTGISIRPAIGNVPIEARFKCGNAGDTLGAIGSVRGEEGITDCDDDGTLINLASSELAEVKKSREYTKLAGTAALVIYTQSQQKSGHFNETPKYHPKKFIYP